MNQSSQKNGGIAASLIAGLLILCALALSRVTSARPAPGRTQVQQPGSSWWWNFSHQAAAALLGGAVIAGVIFVAQERSDNRRAEQAISISRSDAGRLLVASNSTLLSADLSFIDLRGLFAVDRDLGGTSFQGSNLAGANFVESDLSDVRFFQTNLVGANFLGAEITRSSFDGRDSWGGTTQVCYDASTIWPNDFEPPPADCVAWGGPLDPEPNWVALPGELSDVWLPTSFTLQSDLDRGLVEQGG